MNNWNEIIEKGLPPVGEPLVVTIRDNLQGLQNQLRYPVYYVKDTMKNKYTWKWIYGDMIYDLLPEVSEVIAWQPVPKIFENSKVFIDSSDFAKDTRAAAQEVINSQPTAYDVDKVIGQLEERILSLKDQLMYTHDEDMAVRLRCKMHGLDEAIEIIRAGINE